MVQVRCSFCKATTALRKLQDSFKGNSITHASRWSFTAYFFRLCSTAEIDLIDDFECQHAGVYTQNQDAKRLDRLPNGQSAACVTMPHSSLWVFLSRSTCLGIGWRDGENIC